MAVRREKKQSARRSGRSAKPGKKKQLAVSSWPLAKAKPKNDKKQLAVGHRQLAKPEKNKGKRQNDKKRTRNSAAHQTTFTLPKTHLTHFRELRGKIIEDVIFSDAPDHQDITIKLQDKTALNFSIATGLVLKTEYSDWTTGEQRILRARLLKS